MWYSDMDSQLGDLEEGREEIGGANNTYKVRKRVSAERLRFTIEIEYTAFPRLHTFPVSF
jgi:hypothetical protein